MCACQRNLRTGPRILALLCLLAAVAALPGSAVAQTGAKLTGILYFNHDVMPDLPVTLYSAEQTLQTKSDKSGRFEFDNLPPGAYDLDAAYMDLGVEGTLYGIRVRDKDVGPLSVTIDTAGVVYPLGHDCGRTLWVTYKAGETTDGGVIGTAMLAAETVLPDAETKEARIDLVSQNGPQRRFSLRPDNGKFEFQNVPPGRYRLTAHCHGYRKAQYHIWVTRKSTANVKIVLYKHGHPAICE